MDQWDCIGTQAAPHQSWTLDVVQLSEPAVPPPIDTTNLSGMLRNFQYNTKCIHAVGGDNGAELEIVDCSQLQKDQLLKMDSFQVSVGHNLLQTQKISACSAVKAIVFEF